MNKHLPDEIKAGVELLDEKAPGWKQLTSPELLDMSSCQSCILGQLFGSFDTGLRRLGLSLNDFDKIQGYGFERDYSSDDADLGYRQYDQLTAAWKEALTPTSCQVCGEKASLLRQVGNRQLCEVCWSKQG